jgi:hypothetical protein
LNLPYLANHHGHGVSCFFFKPFLSLQLYANDYVHDHARNDYDDGHDHGRDHVRGHGHDHDRGYEENAHIFVSFQHVFHDDDAVDDGRSEDDPRLLFLLSLLLNDLCAHDHANGHCDDHDHGHDHDLHDGYDCASSSIPQP